MIVQKIKKWKEVKQLSNKLVEKRYIVRFISYVRRYSHGDIKEEDYRVIKEADDDGSLADIFEIRDMYLLSKEDNGDSRAIRYFSVKAKNDTDAIEKVRKERK